MNLVRLNPGIYAEGDRPGRLHFDLVEICEYFGIAPTLANQEVVERQVRLALAGEAPGVPIEVHESDGDGGWRSGS